MPLLTETCDICRKIIISGSYGCRICYEEIQRSGQSFKLAGQHREGTYCSFVCLEKHKRKVHMRKVLKTYSPEHMDELRIQLRGLGYDAAIVNIDCIQIWQNRTPHLLAQSEAEALLLTSERHPLKLRDFGERRGLNYWYTFPTD